MRFDDLILPVGEYQTGACENRPEGLLMYSRGVPVPVIAAWCRVDVRRLHRTIDKHTNLNPEWFDRCWRTHDQSAPGSTT